MNNFERKEQGGAVELFAWDNQFVEGFQSEGKAILRMGFPGRSVMGNTRDECDCQRRRCERSEQRTLRRPFPDYGHARRRWR